MLSGWSRDKPTYMLTWGVILFLLVLFAVLGAWQRHVDRQSKKSALLELHEAKERGTHKPITQYPQIDPYSCIGCGSCIAACPEEEVIGLVNGIAHIVNGSRCVGHALCETACPVGAIKVGLGETSVRPDIPVLSEQMETSIPGIFIAGELGGFSLIRNAITQGALVVETIARRLRDHHVPAEPDVLDLVIVGAGPAGLSASLKATEHKLNFVTISREEVGGTIRKYPRRKLTLLQPANIPLHGRLKGGEYEKEELVEFWDKLVQKHDVRVRTGVGLVGVKQDGSLLDVQTTDGNIRCRNVVLALGRRGTPRKLGIPGEDGTNVLYHLVDAATFSGQHVLIVGGGDSAIEAAIALANQGSNTVTVSYRQKNFFRIKTRNQKRIQEYIENKRVQVIFSSRVDSIEPKAATLSIERDGGKESLRIPNDFVFALAGGDPPYPLLKQIGIRFGGEDFVALLKTAA